MMAREFVQSGTSSPGEDFQYPLPSATVMLTDRASGSRSPLLDLIHISGARLHYPD
jgi:hypothetical protein